MQSFKEFAHNKRPQGMTIQKLDSLCKRANQINDSFSGNCGMFAIGLAKFLKEKYKFSVDYGLMIPYHMEKTPNDLRYGDYDLMHIIVYVKELDQGFDGSGLTKNAELKAINNEYPNDGKIIYFPAPNLSIEQAIQWNTNYSISWQYYQNLFGKLDI
jgi:hypothetical protein